jgi:tetratricopeptide (TPR) repeat protein
MPSYTHISRLALCGTLLLGATMLWSSPAAAQGSAVTPAGQTAAAASSAGASVESLVLQGDRESAARRSAAALALFERAVAADGRHAPALWRAAREAVDLGEVETDAAKRNALYARAMTHARRAVEFAPTEAEARFQLARAVGRTALTLGPRDRVKFATEVRDHALEALRLDARHAGALHVLGVWHAEVMRLNGFTRAMARTFLGGKVFESASWAEAVRNLEESVRLEPTRLVHRLDLARIYRDMGRRADARASYEAALRSPLIDANDEYYRQSAEAELRRLPR